MTAVQLHQQALEAPRIPQPRGEVRMYELVLVALPSATTCVRLLVRYAAARWRLDSKCAQELGRVAEALVHYAITVARRQGKSTEHDGAPDLQDLIVFRLHLTPRAVLVEVWDLAAEAPAQFPVEAAEDGGCDFPRQGLRVMWCAVRTSLIQEGPGPSVPAGIPRRERLQGPARASVALQDQQLLQRVLNGLKTLHVGDEPSSRRS